MKSSIRVRDLGEVFTPNITVQAMLDLLPAAVWNAHPTHTFLEPACGDGNFLVAILDRKLKQVRREQAQGSLAGGPTSRAARFHALEALASIYAVDISVENVVGGTPGHEIGARNRLLASFADWDARAVPADDNEQRNVLRAAGWIVEHNILVGNMLPFTAAGEPTGRDKLPLISYDWDPVNLEVTLRKTTMGEVMGAAQCDSAGTTALFAAVPTLQWQGDGLHLWQAARVEAPLLRGPARNGLRAREA